MEFGIALKHTKIIPPHHSGAAGSGLFETLYFFLAAQGLQGLQAFFAAQGLQAPQPFFFAAQGLQGLQAFFAEHGLQALLGAQDAKALGRVAVAVMAAMATDPRMVFIFAVGFDIGTASKLEFLSSRSCI
ncbi:MAG: hypothetical protein H8E30_04660 [Alphaproteobacteria bacterium]|nr:hypothetical protein [Alphaproteobacteria bacterium]